MYQVLATSSVDPNLGLYAHCTPRPNTIANTTKNGSVSILIVNFLRTKARVRVHLGHDGHGGSYSGRRLDFILTPSRDADPFDPVADLNGHPLLGLEGLVGVQGEGEVVQMPALSYGFVVLVDAGVSVCS